ncbi:copper homeostasis protein CutC [Salipiger sp. IMCC34102]|uniref:copper homeostasis protein CutC n=1 Tax=Salipiger sp. IMCC34102 TaxID=2510647 RepID=UPI00101C6EA0|nr:copper homeostasis protein CutC [Salipiger sp. IMCC34102]RYH04485.1 copper homeostasis protein CutC [Salipiger sp. IMCC34102]
MIALEVCVDDPAGIAAAVDGGADRLELCAALGLGGLSPSAGLIALAARCGRPVMAMIRPRAGDFVWSAEERDAMLAEIAAVRDAGLSGVVMGASLPDGRLDPVTLASLAEAARGLDITLHRAIDLTPDPAEALALCQALGIRRVLSSGGARSAAQGLDRLAMMQAAAPEMTVMPGGGVSVATLPLLASRLTLTEVHASCSLPAPPPSHPGVADFGFQPPGARTTDRDTVAALRRALDQLEAFSTRG